MDKAQAISRNSRRAQHRPERGASERQKSKPQASPSGEKKAPRAEPKSKAAGSKFKDRKTAGGTPEAHGLLAIPTLVGTSTAEGLATGIGASTGAATHDILQKGADFISRGWEKALGATSRIFSADASQPASQESPGNVKASSASGNQNNVNDNRVVSQQPSVKSDSSGLPFVSPSDTRNPKNVRKLLKVLKSFDFSDVGPSGYIDEGKPDYIKNLHILAMNPNDDDVDYYLRDNAFEVDKTDPLSIVARKNDLNIEWSFDEPTAVEQSTPGSQEKQKKKKPEPKLDQSLMETDDRLTRHLIDWNQTSLHLNNVVSKSDTLLSDPAKRLVNQTLWKNNQFETPDNVRKTIENSINVDNSQLDDENFELLLKQAGINYKPQLTQGPGISLRKWGSDEQTNDTIMHTIQLHPQLTRSSFRVNHNLSDKDAENPKPLLENLNIVKYPEMEHTMVEQVLWPDLADIIGTTD